MRWPGEEPLTPVCEKVSVFSIQLLWSVSRIVQLRIESQHLLRCA